MIANKRLFHVSIIIIFVLTLFISFDLKSQPLVMEKESSSKDFFFDNFRTFLDLIHGDPVRVVPSPSVCKGQDNHSREDHIKPKEWYLGVADCTAVYNPNIYSIFSPLTKFATWHLLDNRKYYNLLNILSSLTDSIKEIRLPPLKKLEVQSTLWEILLGIYMNRQNLDEISVKELKQLLSKINELLDMILLSDLEIEQLPDGMSILSEVDYHQTSNVIGKLANHDINFLELLSPMSLHIANLQGRFHMRIFLTVREQEQLTLRRYLAATENVELIGFPHILEEKQTANLKDTNIHFSNYQELKDLPYRFSDVNSILILFFNALNKKYEIAPTNIIAYWQEYKFDGSLDKKISLTENINKIEFTSIEYIRSLNKNKEVERSKYRIVPDEELSLRGSLFNVNPLRKGAKVTTHRGNCLMCHIHSIASLAARSPQKIVFKPPFLESSEEIVNKRFRQYENKIQEILKFIAD